MKTLHQPRARHVGILSALLLALGTVALPQDTVGQGIDLSGEWVLTVTSPNGVGERHLTIVQHDDVLSGEISSSRASGELSGTINDDQVTFVAVVQMDTGPFEIIYDATVTGDEMEGTVDFGDYGTGTFIGHRVKSSGDVLIAP